MNLSGNRSRSIVVTIVAIIIGGLALTLGISEVWGLLRALFGRPSQSGSDEPTTD